MMTRLMGYMEVSYVYICLFVCIYVFIQNAYISLYVRIYVTIWIYTYKNDIIIITIYVI
jgi:hypothetical protein